LLVENYVQSPRLCLTTFLNCWSRNGRTKHTATQHIVTTQHTQHAHNPANRARTPQDVTRRLKTSQDISTQHMELALAVCCSRVSRRLHLPVAGATMLPWLPGAVATHVPTRRRRRRCHAGAHHVFHHKAYRCPKRTMHWCSPRQHSLI